MSVRLGCQLRRRRYGRFREFFDEHGRPAGNSTGVLYSARQVVAARCNQLRWKEDSVAPPPLPPPNQAAAEGFSGRVSADQDRPAVVT